MGPGLFQALHNVARHCTVLSNFAHATGRQGGLIYILGESVLSKSSNPDPTSDPKKH